MVVHQDEGMDGDTALPTGLAQEVSVVVAVVVVDEDGAAIHAALGDVHRDARQFQAGLAWHVRSFPDGVGSIMRWLPCAWYR